MTKDELITELRGRMGDLSEAQLPETQLSRALGAALRELARYKKRDTPSMLNLSASVFDYEIPAGTVAVRDMYVFPTYLLWSNIDPLMLTLQLPTLSMEGLLALVGIKPVEHWPMETQVIPPDTTAAPPRTITTLRFLSIPDVASTVFFLARTPLGYADLTDEDQESLLLWAKGDCYEYLGLKRSKPVKRIPTAAGNVLLDDGVDLRKEGKAMKKEFAAQLGSGATVIERG